MENKWSPSDPPPDTTPSEPRNKNVKNTFEEILERKKKALEAKKGL